MFHTYILVPTFAVVHTCAVDVIPQLLIHLNFCIKHTSVFIILFMHVYYASITLLTFVHFEIIYNLALASCLVLFS